MHLTIVALTLVDLAVVVTELILSSIYPVREEAPHAGGRLTRGGGSRSRAKVG